MGDRWLTDLADVCRRTGRPVMEVDGWQWIARSSGGYTSGLPNHVMAHHTASNPSSDGWGDVNYMTFGADAAPMCNLYLSRDGTIWVCAGGATNTNGSGVDPCGAIADDTMNSSAIGIEAANNGVGEPWPDVQLDTYVALCWELCAWYAIPVSRIHAHFEYAPDRKIDPAGPPRYAQGGASWDMDAFRLDVVGHHQPTPEPPTQEDDVAIYVFESQTEPKEFNAMFFGTGDTEGRTIELQWSGDGSDPRVQERVATMLDNFGPARPLLLAGVKNNRLHPKHQPTDLVDSLHTWTAEDFAP